MSYRVTTDGILMTENKARLVFILFHVLKLPQITIGIVFFILASITSSLLDKLNDRGATLGRTLAENYQNTDANHQLGIQLDEWRRHVELINSLIDEINDDFGLVILINLCHFFIASITNFFEMITIYTFWVFIYLRYDLAAMEKTLWFPMMEKHLLPPELGDALFESFKNVVCYRHMYQLLVVMAVPNHLQNICSLWFRFLIILIASQSIERKVRTRHYLYFLSFLFI